MNGYQVNNDWLPVVTGYKFPEQDIPTSTITVYIYMTR